MTSAHICAETTVCCCYLLAYEPNERCPIHGCGPWPPRCAECGRLLPWSIRDKPRRWLSRRPPYSHKPVDVAMRGTLDSREDD